MVRSCFMQQRYKKFTYQATLKDKKDFMLYYPGL
jgi:hypothetical protein